MKRLLMIAYYFPPTATSGAMRPLGFCRYLRDHGWQVSVLAADAHSVWPALEIDERLSQRLPADVAVRRVRYTPAARRIEELRATLSGGAAEPAARSVRAETPRRSGASVVRRAAAAVHRRVCGALEFPDRQSAWFGPAVRAALAGGARYEAIYATGGPWTTLRIGLSLAERWELPLVTDFRDPWTRNPSLPSAAPRARVRAGRLERQVCRRSAWVIANTEELRQQFAADYPDLADRFVTITNGFDVAPQPAGPPPPGARFELCHFGTVYGGRAPVNLLRALDVLTGSGRVDSDRFLLRFVGRWEVDHAECNALAARLEARGVVSREAPMPHTACLAEMQRAGALLVLQSGFPLQIPAKIYEYVATGRPLVLIGGDGATASLIRRHHLGDVCADEPREAAALIEGLVSDSPRAAERSDRAAFHYRTLTAALAARLDDAIGAAPSRMRTAS
jgi:hypothetical protein